MTKEIPTEESKAKHTEFRQKVQGEYESYLSGLFAAAWENAPFDFICTILRASGVHYGHWDPLEEIYQATADYSSILEKALEEENQKKTFRIGLLMYCNVIEATAVHEILANLLKCQAGSPFILNPFRGLRRSKKKRIPLFYVPPSAKTKYEEVKRIAASVGNNELIKIVDGFFDDRIRNAFVHSDYCITDEELRWTEGGPASSVSLEYLSEIITRAFAFHEELFTHLRLWRQKLAQIPKFHKFYNYEVLELLSNESGIYGFKVHFSNGSRAYYERHPDRVDAVNVLFERDGTINFMAGDLDSLESVWKVNGEVVTDWDKLNEDYSKNDSGSSGS